MSSLSGEAGASAQREYERRRRADEARVLDGHPRLGRLLLAFRSDRASTAAWAKGAAGERLVAAQLDSLAARGVMCLHDRHEPGRRSNIDHIAVAPSGVFVIDSKHYRGRVERRRRRKGSRLEIQLVVNGRDRTHLAEALDAQRRTVEAIMQADDVPVTGVLCFIGTDWPLLEPPFDIRGVLVTPPRSLRRRLARGGTLTPDRVSELVDSLARALPAA